MIQWAQQMTAKLPRFYCFWTGPLRPSILLNHPDTVSTLLRTAGIYLYSCTWHQFVLMHTTCTREQDSNPFSELRKKLYVSFSYYFHKMTLSIRNRCLNDGRG